MSRRSSKKRRKRHSWADRLAVGRRGGVIGTATTHMGDVFELVSYEIVSEPMPDPYLDSLPPAERSEIHRVIERFRESAASQVAELERLLERHPDYPKLFNYLTVAYEHSGRYEEAEDLVYLTYEMFPTYLFGRTAYATACLLEGRFEEARAALGHLAIHRVYPERRGRFHVTEWATFNSTVAWLLAEEGELEEADSICQMLSDMGIRNQQMSRVEKTIRAKRLRRWFVGDSRRNRAAPDPLKTSI